jgi:hypothetical protein
MNRFILTAPLGFILALTAVAPWRDARRTNARKGDALRLCAADIPDEAAITASLKKNTRQLSPGCKAAFKQSPAPKKRKMAA